MNFLMVSIGGAISALVRWGLGFLLNPIFPTLPIGTLVANLTGGYIIGIMVALLQLSPFYI